MRLLKGYKLENNRFVDYPYENISILIWQKDKKLEEWMPYSDYSVFPTIEIGEVMWNETTQNI